MKNVLIAFVLCLLSWPTLASEPVSTGWLSDTAVGGYDVTAYHQLARSESAVKGEKIYQVRWKNANWYFVSEAEKLAFEQNPERYAPAYNGHCANALSLGEGLVKTNGEHWAVLDGQLYLFYAPRGAQRWLDGDYSTYKREADRAWKTILQKR